MQDIIFKHTVPLQLRFNDIDALGHVNNSVYFTFYDLGKARYFEEIKQKRESNGERTHRPKSGNKTE